MVAKRKLKVHENPVETKPATKGFLFRVSDIRIGSEVEYSTLRHTRKIRFVVDAIHERNRMINRAYANHTSNDVYLISSDGLRVSVTAGTIARSVNWEMIA